jgi:hypothetical protein
VNTHRGSARSGLYLPSAASGIPAESSRTKRRIGCGLSRRSPQDPNTCGRLHHRMSNSWIRCRTCLGLRSNEIRSIPMDATRSSFGRRIRKACSRGRSIDDAAAERFGEALFAFLSRGGSRHQCEGGRNQQSRYDHEPTPGHGASSRREITTATQLNFLRYPRQSTGAAFKTTGFARLWSSLGSGT